MTDQSIVEFNRKKIFERLDYLPQPAGYKSSIPWVVQNQIAATNGIHYVDRVGKLKGYPLYSLPIRSVSGEKLMLDIGSGWGRWLISGHRKGYVPIGLDIRLEFCETQQKTLKAFGCKGYSVVGDLENLPFKSGVFDLIWSFSVIQHTHMDRLLNCLRSIKTILSASGRVCIQFPNKNGLRNRLGPARMYDREKDDYNSWAVRYYTTSEYEKIFKDYFREIKVDNHSFLGIGVLPEDIKYVSIKNKILCAISLFLSFMTKIIPGLKYYSDSIYLRAESSNKQEDRSAVMEFFRLHHSAPFDNLNIIPLLACPISGGPLILHPDRNRLLSEQAGVYYPVINNIPILISSEAVKY